MHRAITVKGVHIFRHFAPKTRADERLIDELQKWYEIGKGHLWLPKVQHLLVQRHVCHNIVVDSGLNFLAKILCNTAEESSKYVTHFAIGDDNTAATAGDTALGNEVFRKAVSSRLDDDSVANISTFIGASEANVTWEEWGHFIDGTSDADSGTMLSHHIQQQSKSAPNTVTVDSTFTFADA
jgi:hypothetical protein